MYRSVNNNLQFEGETYRYNLQNRGVRYNTVVWRMSRLASRCHCYVLLCLESEKLGSWKSTMNFRPYISKNNVKGKLKAAHLLSLNGPKWRKRRSAPRLKRVNGRKRRNRGSQNGISTHSHTYLYNDLGHWSGLPPFCLRQMLKTIYNQEEVMCFHFFPYQYGIVSTNDSRLIIEITFLTSFLNLGLKEKNNFLENKNDNNLYLLQFHF